MPIQQMLLGIGAAETFTVATGGTITTDGDFKVHEFTSTGTFTVTTLGSPNSFEILTVSGGASASSNTYTTGGGGGGVVNHQTDQALTAAAYTITIGAGGAQISFNAFGALGNHGSDSSVALASNGNVVVDSDVSDLTNGDDSQCHGDGTTSTRSVGGSSFKLVNSTTTQFTGGSGANSTASGGGAGSGANGSDATGTDSSTIDGQGGNGGAGFATTITGSSANFGGGGGGGSYNNSNDYQASGGAGGGGTGAGFTSAATSGSANTGGGGGGTKSGYFQFDSAINNQGGAGGSGIVYIRYKFQ